MCVTVYMVAFKKLH